MLVVSQNVIFTLYSRFQNDRPLEFFCLQWINFLSVDGKARQRQNLMVGYIFNYTVGLTSLIEAWSDINKQSCGGPIVLKSAVPLLGNGILLVAPILCKYWYSIVPTKGLSMTQRYITSLTINIDIGTLSGNNVVFKDFHMSPLSNQITAWFSTYRRTLNDAPTTDAKCRCCRNQRRTLIEIDDPHVRPPFSAARFSRVARHVSLMGESDCLSIEGGFRLTTMTNSCS